MMYTIEQLREIIKAELDKQEYVEEPYSLFEPIKYIMEDGGKRLRPVLTLMAYNLYRDDIGKALKSAIGIEIFHNYTLLHDDVMDDAAAKIAAYGATVGATLSSDKPPISAVIQERKEDQSANNKPIKSV